MTRHHEPPSRVDVTACLVDLASTRITPSDASKWASSWLSRLHEIDDQQARQTLERLAAADMLIAPGKFLYTHADFAAWLLDLHG